MKKLVSFVSRPCVGSPPNRRAQTRTGTKQPGPAGMHRQPSLVSGVCLGQVSLRRFVGQPCECHLGGGATAIAKVQKGATRSERDDNGAEPALW